MVTSMTLTDILSSDILTQTGTDLKISQILITLVLSFVLGLFVFLIYRKTFQGVMYSKSFNISLIALSMVSSTVILGVTSNIILSLGMVGALSIVRFRTAIKDPIDVVYMFWAIAVGIITGAGIYDLVIISSILIGAMLIIFSKINTKNEPYLIVINYSNDKIEKLVFEVLKKHIGNYIIKSKTKSPTNFEMTIEIRSKTGESEIVNYLDALEGVSNVAMVSYDGEYAV